MIERRLAARRFADFYPDEAPPRYPAELERRHLNRRGGDHVGVVFGPDALFPGLRRRPRVLFSGIWKCDHCGCELHRARNLSREGRKYFLAEHAFHVASRLRCGCGARPQLEWVFQAGIE